MELPSLMNQPVSMHALVREREGERLGTNANISWTAVGMLTVLLLISHGLVAHVTL